MENNSSPTFDKVWLMFQEIAEENARRSLELDKKFQEIAEENARRSLELDKELQTTSKDIRKMSKEITRLNTLFTTQWGRLIESLVEGDLINILRQYGINIVDTSKNVESREKGYEFDIIAHNGEEVVIVEVKTTLRAEDINYFLEKLSKVKEWMPRYQHNKIYGAVAYLKAAEGAGRFAERKGLFVIRATGNSAAIVNAPDFRPKIF